MAVIVYTSVFFCLCPVCCSSNVLSTGYEASGIAGLVGMDIDMDHWLWACDVSHGKQPFDIRQRHVRIKVCSLNHGTRSSDLNSVLRDHD